MTCKDCMHYKLCEYNTYQEAHYFGKDKEIYVTIDNNSPCKYFTDCSEWVHLPCKRVYFICDKGTKFAMVMSKSIKDLSIYEIKEIDKSGYYFSTKEEAEKALKGDVE